MAGQLTALGGMGQDIDIDRVTAAPQRVLVSKARRPRRSWMRCSASLQATGVPINSLADAALKRGPALRQFGSDMAQSAGMAGLFDKAGLTHRR